MLWGVALGLCCCKGFPLVVASGGYSPVVVLGLLPVGAALVIEHRPQGLQYWRLPGSRVQAQELWCTNLIASWQCGIFLDQGSNLGLLPWQADCLPLSHQGILLYFIYKKIVDSCNYGGTEAQLVLCKLKTQKSWWCNSNPTSKAWEPGESKV